ncbi:mechanosensitive ion channel family protein [Spirulina major]|uniref:mechanosensitive ion channel family protein n=1 Tax=Spirulina major TaxID=270636 RepID=UPI00093437CB|nr:mechanosensitive ion channel domain-containing protein [Spirulina major]
MDFAQFSPVVSQIIQWLDQHQLLNAIVFLSFFITAIIIGRYTPTVVRLITYRFAPKQGRDIYDRWIDPIRHEIRVTGTLLLINISLSWLIAYGGVYDFVRPIMELAVTISLAWLISRLIHLFLQVYGIAFVQKMGLDPDELILPFESVINVMIGLIAAIAYAQSQDINLIGLVASLGVAATAVGFAAQSALSQIIGTIVLYLDRPYVKGEYIRLPNGLFGRVESIGLRSTKIRTPAKNTLVIVPNSSMADAEIENITRGKKVMVLLYLNFLNSLQVQEKALVEQVIKESTDALVGIDPGSTRIQLTDTDEQDNSRARVTFFILGSSENSIQLRKRLLELANETISRRLAEYGLDFTTPDPTIYVDSPVTL